MMNEKVGIEVHRLIGQRCARTCRRAARNRLTRGKRRCMAEGTAYLRENGPSIHDRRSIRGRRWRGQHPHEVGKRLDIRDDGSILVRGGRRGGGEIKRVLRGRVQDATWRLIALLREQLVRDAHLNVICLTSA